MVDSSYLTSAYINSKPVYESRVLFKTRRTCEFVCAVRLFAFVFNSKPSGENRIKLGRLILYWRERRKKKKRKKGKAKITFILQFLFRYLTISIRKLNLIFERKWDFLFCKYRNIAVVKKREWRSLEKAKIIIIINLY